MLISIVLPTHDRPLLLKEAIASVKAQTHSQWELIVVDDASDPPVALDEQDLGGDRLRLVPNSNARGPSGARNSGMEVASGDVVTFVDDDDLIAPGALALIADAFAADDSLECLFVNVEPFGELAEGTHANQARAVRRILVRLGLDPDTTAGRLALTDNLFEVLLDGVPMAFQRVAIRRSALLKVGRYAGSGFEDIEFYLRIALRCRCTLLADPVYRPRCAGQSYFTRSESRNRLADASIRIRQGLLALPEVSQRADLRRSVRRSLADAHFERAYLAYQAGHRFPWKDFVASCATGVAWRQISVLGKLLARAASGRNRAATGS
jgi:glycosyltransferase involved in cell wall biosynthesis